MARILLLIRGTGGDLFPFLRIGRALHHRDHAVTLFSHYPYQERAQQAGVPFTAIDRPEDLAEMIRDEPMMQHPRDLLAFNRRHIIPKLADECRLLMEQVTPEQTVLVAHLNSYMSAKLVSEVLGIPLVIIYTAPSFMLTLPILVEMYHALADEINQERAKLGLAPVSDWRTWGYAATRGIAFWPDWFCAPTAESPVDVVPVGFVPGDAAVAAEIPQVVREFLAEGEPPILITHGTSVPTSDSFFSSSVEACRQLGQRALLVTRLAALVPPDLPPTVRWVEYLPFDRVMESMRLIIHHGGIGTVSQAITAAVPQIVLASGFDRPDNAMQVQRLGVGRYLPPSQWQPQPIAEAIQQLIESEHVQARGRELSQLCRAADPMTELCATIEGCLEADTVGATMPGIEEEVKNGRLRDRLANLSPKQRAQIKARLSTKAQIQSISAD